MKHGSSRPGWPTRRSTYGVYCFYCWPLSAPSTLPRKLSAAPAHTALPICWTRSFTDPGTIQSQLDYGKNVVFKISINNVLRTNNAAILPNIKCEICKGNLILSSNTSKMFLLVLKQLLQYDEKPDEIFELTPSIREWLTGITIVIFIKCNFVLVAEGIYCYCYCLCLDEISTGLH